MSARTSSIALWLALLGGCFASHELPSGAECGGREPPLAVSIEPPAGFDSCGPDAVHVGVLADVAASGDEVSFLFERPECAERVRVRGSGVASELAGLRRFTGEQVQWWIRPPSDLQVERIVTCCGECFCGPLTVVLARSGNPARETSMLPPELDFGAGVRRCGPTDECGLVGLGVTAEVSARRRTIAERPAPIDVAPGETAVLGETGLALHVQWASNQTCEDAGPEASWVVWARE